MNKAVLMGRLTKDPELRYTQNNTAVCNFTLAIDRPYVKDGEERQADFIPIIAWGKLGETCSKYLEKGRKISIIGRIQTRTWDDAEGKKHYVTEVVAEEMHFCDSKKSDGGGQQVTPQTAQYSYAYAPQTAQQCADPPPASAPAEKPPWM